MAQFKTVGKEALSRLPKKETPFFVMSAPYREALSKLRDGQIIEILPDEGDTMRMLKLNTGRSAKAIGKDVEYGATTDGALLVWLAKRKPKTGDQYAG